MAHLSLSLPSISVYNFLILHRLGNGTKWHIYLCLFYRVSPPMSTQEIHTEIENVLAGNGWGGGHKNIPVGEEHSREEAQKASKEEEIWREDIGPSSSFFRGWHLAAITSGRDSETLKFMLGVYLDKRVTGLAQVKKSRC